MLRKRAGLLLGQGLIMKHYINLKGTYRETVDEFDTRKEAIAMLREYRFASPGLSYYLSARCCKNWRE